jgi:hypothetical protein
MGLTQSHPSLQVAKAARTDGKELTVPAINKVRRALIDPENIMDFITGD